jgi:bifunctional non-homologous end joining protein LigD
VCAFSSRRSFSEALKIRQLLAINFNHPLKEKTVNYKQGRSENGCPIHVLSEVFVLLLACDAERGHMTLSDYRNKRNFQKTPEPAGSETPGGRAFVVQKHAATRLHYDLRLEWDGVLKSWAVPRGPSLNPGVKRLAVEVEDHPVEYGDFEGVIPRGEYGAGTVLVWDKGSWQAVNGDPSYGFRKGHIDFRLFGSKLTGLWTLTRMHQGKDGEPGRQWLLFKKPDEASRSTGKEIIDLAPDSVKSGRGLAQVAEQESTDELLRRRAARSDPPWQPVPEGMIPGDQPEDEPPVIEPELPSLVDRAPEGGDWIHEIKYDGYRILTIITHGRVRMLSRRGNDWTANFPALAASLSRLPVERALLDGEVVARGADGGISFHELQKDLHAGGNAGLEYILFDLLHLNGYSTRSLPLSDRKRLLETLLNAVRETEPKLRFSEAIRGDGPAVYRAACRTGLEGIVSKRAGSAYASGRTKDWVKLKCLEEQEFVAGGFTVENNSQRKVGALLLGYFDHGELIYCGRVGTGFSEDDRSALFERLDAARTEESPFAELPRAEESAGAVWTAPRMVVEVRFAEWTDDGRLREPVFLGVREDKPAETVGRDNSIPLERGDSPFVRILPHARKHLGDSDSAEIGGVRFTHASRVMYPGMNLTKRDLAEYYLRIAGGFLPEIRRRPLVLVRCPEGFDGECFFQKHADASMPEALPAAVLPGAGEDRPALTADGIQDILRLVQAGTLEFHTWGCRVEDPLKPDRIVFDLDPDPELDPAVTIQAALDLRRALEDSGLTSFPRTTGGKGLHVVVPILPEYGWDTVKAFSRRIAQLLVHGDPQHRTAVMAKDKRHAKVFIDYFRNARGASSIAAYSTRARAGAPVAVPLAWDEVRPGLSFHALSIADMISRWEQVGDPWKNLPDNRQHLPPAA